MNADYYTAILEEGPFPAAFKVLGDSRTLQRDDASDHTAAHETLWLKANKIHTWPAHPPDLNIIQIVRGYFAWNI